MSAVLNQPSPLNPFSFERNHKKFVHKLEEERNEQNAEQDEQEEVQTQAYYENLYRQSKNQSKYGIIRALHEEAQKIAKERDEMFARDHTLDPVMQRLKHFSVRLMHDSKETERQKKNYRIRNILKEKRETIAEYVNKKREIFLSNMNISIKKEETTRLEDFIKNEQESLRARQLYFKNDCELVRKFMNEVKVQADRASDKADAEAKKKEIQKEEMTQINTLIERLRLQKTKLKDEYDRLCQYKEFIEKLKTNYQSIFDEIQSKKVVPKPPTMAENSKLFVTDVDTDNKQLVKQTSLEQIERKMHEEEQQRMAELLIEILNHIQEKNLQYIQNQHDSEEELEQKKREYQQLQEQLFFKQNENIERLRGLSRQIDSAQHQKQMLEQLNRVNSSKLQFSDGEDLDMERIGKVILEIQREVSKEGPKKTDKEVESKELHRAMTEIEQLAFKLLDLRRDIIRNPKFKVEFLDPLEKKLKLNEKKARQNRTQIDDKAKILQEKLQKKEEYLSHFYKGRKPMFKWFLDKKTGEKKVVVVEKVDDYEKYFNENYELGYDEKTNAHLETHTKSQMSQQI